MEENVIQLTETQLRHMLEKVCSSIIREELQKYLITEMVHTLKEYKEKTDNLIPQIVENWCLVRYCTLSDDKQELKDHWRKELIAHLTNVAQMKLKNGNSPTVKQNALYFLWNRRDIDTDENVISMMISTKFEKEGLPTSGPIFAQVVEDFKNSTKDIIDAILSDFPGRIIKYVCSI